jgi:hypothetical protein
MGNLLQIMFANKRKLLMDKGQVHQHHAGMERPFARI